MLEEQSPDAQMHRRALGLGDQRVGGLLDAIVREAIGIPHLEQQIFFERRPQRDVGIASEDDGERVGVHGGPEARGELEGLLRLGRQVMQLAHDQLDDVVGESLRADAGEIPAPGARVAVERDQPLPVQRGQELDDEEGVAGGLLAHQAGERRGLRGRAVERVGDELARGPPWRAAPAGGCGSARLRCARRRAPARAGARGRPRCPGRRPRTACVVCSDGSADRRPASGWPDPPTAGRPGRWREGVPASRTRPRTRAAPGAAGSRPRRATARAPRAAGR